MFTSGLVPTENKRSATVRNRRRYPAFENWNAFSVSFLVDTFPQWNGTENGIRGANKTYMSNSNSSVPVPNSSVPSRPIAGKNQVLIPDLSGELFAVWYKPGARLGDFMVKNGYAVEQTANAKEALKSASAVAGQSAFRSIQDKDIVSVTYSAVIRGGVPIVKAKLNAELKATAEFASLFNEKANKALETGGKSAAKYNFVAASLRKDKSAIDQHTVGNSKTKPFVERPMKQIEGADSTVESK